MEHRTPPSVPAELAPNGAASGCEAPTDPDETLGRELMGIELRYFLTLTMLRTGGPTKVSDLVAALQAEGLCVAGRPSKVVSDCLRWEIARGRVQRLGRGIYRALRVPRTTLRRMRSRVGAAMVRPRAPVRVQPLWAEPKPLVSPDGPWRYRLRYVIMEPPRTPWGYGIRMAPRANEPVGEVERGLRRQRVLLDERRRAAPFGPEMR